MTIAVDNVANHRQMYIISCMNVPKQSQLVQKNEKLFMMWSLALYPSKVLIGVWSVLTPSVSTWVIVC